MNGLGFLAALGTNAPVAVPVLIRCLQDEDWRVAAWAAGALGRAADNIGGEQLKPQFAERF